MHFSIVIPAKNEEVNIDRCLDSINRMEWDKSQYEVIVVDNGSTDGTVKISQNKGARVYVKPELTISGLRNFGASKAAGEILAFIDADCTVSFPWLRKAARYLDQRNVVCFGSPPVVPERATWVQKAWFQVRRKKVLIGETDWLESMNMFVRRNIFLECGGFDEGLVTCEDYDLSLRLKKYGLLINDCMIMAVHHGEAATSAHFFRKELWRGKSNFKKLLRHGIVLGEVPGIIAPLVHCALVVSVTVSPLLYPSIYFWTAIFLFILWQIMIMGWSCIKNVCKIKPMLVLQLYWLLNVYFLARGLSVFLG